MLRTYKYILELHPIENGKYSIIHLLSPICISLDNQKTKTTWMHSKYVINQHHYDKIKDYPHVDH